MQVNKDTRGFDLPWEREFGYAQAVKVADTIFIAGQVAHDDQGNFVGIGDMQAQMRAAYRNVGRLLAMYGGTMADLVDETLYVTDIEAAYAAAVACRKEIFGGNARLASTVVQVQRLTFPELMIEIRCVAKVAAA